MDFNYTFHYRLSYQEAYDTFYLLATRLTRKKKNNLWHTPDCHCGPVLGLLWFGYTQSPSLSSCHICSSPSLLFTLLSCFFRTEGGCKGRKAQWKLPIHSQSAWSDHSPSVPGYPNRTLHRDAWRRQAQPCS